MNETEIKNQVATLTEGYELMTCDTREEYAVICKQKDMAAKMMEQVTEYWDGTKDKPGPIKKAYDTWKDLTGKRGAMLKPLEAFVSVCGKVGGKFLADEQQREQARLDQIRRQAEEIRARQEAELRAKAEKLRKEQEAEAARQREALRNSPAELARQAEILKAQQAEAQAQLKRDAESRMVDTDSIPLTAAKVEAGEGQTTVQTWKFEVVDEAIIPREYLMLNEAAVKKIVTALKDKTNIPGIRVHMETSVRIRR